MVTSVVSSGSPKWFTLEASEPPWIMSFWLAVMPRSRAPAAQASSGTPKSLPRQLHRLVRHPLAAIMKSQPRSIPLS